MGPLQKSQSTSVHLSLPALIEHLSYNEKCYLSASPPVDLRDGLIITLINMGALLGSQAAGQVLNLDSLNNRLSGSLLSGPVEVSAQEQRRINENGQIVYQPVVSVRLNGTEVGRLVGVERNFGQPGLVQIAEMDPGNPYPEVLLSSHEGGWATHFQVLTSDTSGKKWREVTLGPFSNGGDVSPAEDPLQTGRFLIVNFDNRFLYRFAARADSKAPTRLWELEGDRFVDVSHRQEFIPLHRRNLQHTAEWFQQKNMSNGYLAAYVANKALVGELYDGWDQMSRRYDTSSDWGLKACKGDLDDRSECPGREIVYGSFPEALRAFLIKTGYIKPTGEQ